MASQVGLTLCLLLVASYAGVKGTEPDTSQCKQLGQYIEDQDNCSNYYLCIGVGEIIPVVQACDDLHPCFDPDPAVSKCIDDTTSTPPNSKCDPTRCPGPPAEKCIFDCDDPDAKFAANYGDCSKYSICSNVGPIPTICKADVGGLYFNGEHCGTDKSMCCSCLHTETCAIGGQLLPEKSDCHKYNICVGAAPDFNLVGPLPCDATGIDKDVCTDLALPCTNACP